MQLYLLHLGGLPQVLFIVLRFHGNLVPADRVLSRLDDVDVVPLRYGFLLSGCRGDDARF